MGSVRLCANGRDDSRSQKRWKELFVQVEYRIHERSGGIMKIVILVLFVVLLSGCAAHYHNAKLGAVDATNVKTKVGKLKKAKVNYKSSLDIWFPWKLKENK